MEVRYGPDGCAVAETGAFDPCAAAPGGWAWAAVDRRTRGTQWHDLPRRYPPYQTCHRRFQQWVRDGIFQQTLEALAEDLWLRGGLNVSECFIDGFLCRLKRGRGIGKTKRAKDSKLMAIADRHVLPLAIDTPSAQSHEVRCVEDTLDICFTEALPERLIGDRAYDSDSLDQRLWRD